MAKKKERQQKASQQEDLPHPVNLDSYVLLEAKMALVAAHVSLITAHEPGLPEDFVVTTIQRDQVVTETLGDLICPYRCSLYLHATFAPCVFTTEEVDRCVEIFQLVLRKATDYDFMNDSRVDVFWAGASRPHGHGASWFPTRSDCWAATLAEVAIPAQPTVS